MERVVYLDAGHAHCTAGKRSPDSSLMEWEFNDYMQNLLELELKRCGFTIVKVNPTPSTGSEVSLGDRCNKANSHWRNNGKPNALYLSIHANSFGETWNDVYGTETFVLKTSLAQATKAATCINNRVYKAMNTKNRGVKEANFYVLRETAMNACLVEVGFYSNQAECEKLKDKAKRKTVAKAIANGVCEFFNVEYKEEGPTPSTGNTFYRVVAGSFKERVNAENLEKDLKDKGYPAFIDIYEIK